MEYAKILLGRSLRVLKIVIVSLRVKNLKCYLILLFYFDSVFFSITEARCLLLKKIEILLFINYTNYSHLLFCARSSAG